MTHHVTIFHNGSILPVGESVECDGDPSVYFGEPDSEAGSIKMWNCGELRVVVSSNVLTTAA